MRGAAVPSRPLSKHLPKNPTRLAAVPTKEVIVQSGATAVIAATTIAGIMVGPERLHERMGNRRAERQRGLMSVDADLDTPGGGHRRVMSANTLDKLPEGGGNLAG